MGYPKVTGYLWYITLQEIEVIHGVFGDEKLYKQ
jgi:hypothetical protein